MKNRVSGAIGFILVLAFGVYFAAQLYRFSQPEVKTQTASLELVYDSMDVFGSIVREEEPMYYAGGGILSVAVKDGERVPVNGVVAKVYATEADFERQLEIKKLSEKIEMLSKSGENGDGNLSEVGELEHKIEEYCKDISGIVSDGQTAEIYNISLSLAGLVSRKQIVAGTMKDYQSNLATLKKSLSELKHSAAAPASVIRAKKSGYFVASADGLEQKLTPDGLAELNASDITPEKLHTVANDGGSGVLVGKLVSDYKWYFVTSIKTEELGAIRQGQTLDLRLPFALDTTLPSTVESINSNTDGSSIVVFSSRYMINELNYVRGLNAEIIFKTYKGMRVDKRALRVVDGVTGVYVLNGSVMKFRPVEILTDCDSFVLVKEDAKNTIKMYDEVVVEGKNLYEGKLIMQ